MLQCFSITTSEILKRLLILIFFGWCNLTLSVLLNTVTEYFTLWSTKWFYCRHAGYKFWTQECITQCKKFKRLLVQKYSTHAKVSNKEAGKHPVKNQAVIQKQRVGLSKDSRQKTWSANKQRNSLEPLRSAQEHT